MEECRRPSAAAEDVLVLLGEGAAALVGVEHLGAAVVQLGVVVAGPVGQAQVVLVAVWGVGQLLSGVGALRGHAAVGSRGRRGGRRGGRRRG